MGQPARRTARRWRTWPGRRRPGRRDGRPGVRRRRWRPERGIVGHPVQRQHRRPGHRAGARGAGARGAAAGRARWPRRGACPAGWAGVEGRAPPRRPLRQVRRQRGGWRGRATRTPSPARISRLARWRVPGRLGWRGARLEEAVPAAAGPGAGGRAGGWRMSGPCRPEEPGLGRRQALWRAAWAGRWLPWGPARRHSPQRPRAGRRRARRRRARGRPKWERPKRERPRRGRPKRGRQMLRWPTLRRPAWEQPVRCPPARQMGGRRQGWHRSMREPPARRLGIRAQPAPAGLARQHPPRARQGW